MVTGKRVIDDFEVEIADSYNLKELQKQWLHIQKSQRIPFFLTWSWISCWLETYHPDVVVISARFNDQIVAIGLFTRSTQLRHGFVRSQQYRLHQMGDPILDQIWMEYNDFICVEEYRVDAVNACLKVLQESDGECDEIVFSMVSASRAEDIQSAIGGTRILATNPSYSKNLDQIRIDGEQYISTLNSNTRYQIRRSIRRYEKLHGELTYSFAQSVEEALAYFREAGKYHVLRWQDSGFKNKDFIAFHENLIQRSVGRNVIDLMKIRSGDTTIAILYFHIVGKDVYFYLQGVNYESDQKLKPGLVAHMMATQHYLEQGMSKYDYMGGYSQYKCQLSALDEQLVTLCIQKPSVMFGLENFGRRIKNIYENIIGREANV